MSLTPIQEFYRDCNIFVTGGTGFLGKVLIEKLLRACPQINALYLLIRTKQGKSPQVRIQELFDDVLFQRVKDAIPDLMSKIIVVSGDVSLPRLGLSAEDRQELIENIDIVFHAAATVKFNEEIKIAYNLNTFGTKDIIDLCLSIKKLKVFAHVSTAYTHCYREYTEEKVYDDSSILNFIDLSREEFNSRNGCVIPASYLKKWPNTYTFTKAMAEYSIKSKEGFLPACIFRPGVVISCHNEPLKGWSDNVYGPTRVMIGIGCGIIRIFYSDPKVGSNFVPVDLTVNALIASARHVGENYLKGKKEIKVFNFVSNPDNLMPYGEFTSLVEKYSEKFPSTKAVWRPFIILTKNQCLYSVLLFTLHFLPASIFDCICILSGKEPSNENVHSLWSEMNRADKNLFDFDIKKIDWHDYVVNYVQGFRTYLLKDDFASLSEAKSKLNRFCLYHRILKVAFFLLLVRLTWNLKFNLSRLWSFMRGIDR